MANRSAPSVHAPIAVAVFATLISWPFAAAVEPVSFNRDIRPIMSDTCFHCHGNDANTREAGMRLDVRDAALEATDGGAVPIVPGDPDASEIIKRIFDEDDPMPPESAHKPLTAEQKELFRRWVAEGAVYEPHWAYAPLTRPALPAGAAGKHPIDAFVEAKLAAKGLAPSPEAPAHVLERRLALDLTGLPPNAALPKGVARPAGDALVDALLASPHYGERMAVWWLDIARYADTVGFHGDQNQRIFPYRDYVIDAFNANKRFDQFTREQLAGDLLPNPTTEQLVATGYNRLNMMTREGGAQPKEYLAKYGAERVRSVAAAWFGSTFGCAECHDHKFDPITSRDFYELQAFFADVKQWGVYANYGYTPEPELEGVNNESPFPPEIEVESPWMKRRLERIQVELDRHLADTARRLAVDPASAAAQAAWEASVAPFLSSHADGWLAPAPVEPRIMKDGKAVEGRSPVVSPMQTVAADKALGKGEAIRVEYDAGGLPAIAAVRLALDMPSFQPDATVKKLGADVTLSLEVRNAAGKARRLPLQVGEATARRPVHRGGAEVPGIQGEWRLPKTAVADDKLMAVWLLDKPLVPAAGDRIVATVTAGAGIPCTVAFSPLAAVEPLDVAAADDLTALGTPRAARSVATAARASAVFLLSTAHDVAAATRAHDLAAQARGLFGGRTWTMVTMPMEKPLSVRVLPRGNWQDESGPVVLPATPSFLPARIESTDDRRLSRLDLANWLVSDANPITPRAVMNRLWAMLFGVGLSAVVDDLGSQGELPTHPELLDWLACEFRDSGWDMKHMIRLIVTSRTYRQASSLVPAALAVDPANRLLSSQNPRRLEAEFVRDNALAIAGLLSLDEIGGPSVKPYQPAGYYASLQFPNRDYAADTDERQWRRGVYTHWQRTFLHPMMANFDAPARDECAAARSASNTPQQALTLLNDPIFVEAARVFAARLLEEPSADDDAARIRLAYRLALNRTPRYAEVTSLTQFLATQRDTFKAAPSDAEKTLAVGLAPRPHLDPLEHAAWTQLARVLLNTQEVITRY
ncbi:MAG: PSD1 and planctomycete cytochrome C domain-containing protein [Planctomycetia bacterium]